MSMQSMMGGGGAQTQILTPYGNNIIISYNWTVLAVEYGEKKNTTAPKCVIHYILKYERSMVGATTISFRRNLCHLYSYTYRGKINLGKRGRKLCKMKV